MKEYKINGFTVCDCTGLAYPYDMYVEIHNALHTYVTNIHNNPLQNKANAFEYLQKILYADFDRTREFDAFIENFTASKNMMIAYAGAMNDEEGDTHMIIAFHEPPFDKITLYRFGTYNEGDAFPVFECEEGLDV